MCPDEELRFGNIYSVPDLFHSKILDWKAKGIPIYWICTSALLRSVSWFLVWWSCLSDRLWRVLSGSSGVFHVQQLRISSSTLVILCYEVDVRVELRFTTNICVIFYSQIVPFSTYFQKLAWLRSLVACFGTLKFSPLSSLQLAMFCAQTLLVQFQYSPWFELKYPPSDSMVFSTVKKFQYMRECSSMVCLHVGLFLPRQGMINQGTIPPDWFLKFTKCVEDATYMHLS